MATTDLPPLGPRDVHIQTAYSGVSSGTDKWVMTGRFKWSSIGFPVVPGYQRFGIVAETGRDVRDFSVGQQVVATRSVDFPGLSTAWGGHCSAGVSPAEEVFDAEGIDPKSGALFVSGQVGYNAAARLSPPKGGLVAVVGDGIIGSSAALCARARGHEVLVLGRHEKRLAPLRELGLATADTSLPDFDLSAFSPSAVIDTVQSDESFGYYIDVLPQRTGELVFSGHSPDGVNHWGDMAKLQQRELTVHFVANWTRDRLQATLGLIRHGNLPLGALVGREASRSSAVELMSDVANGRLKETAAVIDWKRN